MQAMPSMLHILMKIIDITFDIFSFSSTTLI